MPVSKNSQSFKNQFRQFKTLLRHFTIRLFNNDIMKFENQRTENIVILIALLAMAGGLISFIILWPYLRATLGFTSETVWLEKNFFITLSMAITGIISVINWENMFMDRKDYIYLSSLPITPGTLFTAKFFSLLIFVGVLSAALHAAPLFIFTFYINESINVNPFYNTSILKFAGIHLMSGIMANLFVYLGVASIQSLLRLVLGGKWFKKAVMIIQPLLLMGFVSILIWFPQTASAVAEMHKRSDAFIYYFPPLWFTGFYEYMIGNYDVVFRQQFYTAAIALTVMIDIYILSMPVTFRRFSRQTTDGSDKQSHRPGRFKRFRLLPSDPIQRAMFSFTLKTISRSRKHKLQLSTALALPVTFIVSQLITTISANGPDSLAGPKMLMTAVPFIMAVFMIGGFRLTILHPVFIEANWIFRLTEPSRPSGYLEGVKKVFYFFGIVPLTLGLFFFYLSFWDPAAAVLHTLYSITTACLTLEAVFLGYHKIPFVSAYVPGKARLKDFWFLYLAAIGIYISLFTGLGILMLKSPRLYIIYYILAADGFYLLYKHKRKNKPFAGFIFDEEPEPVFLSLGWD